VSCAVLRIFYFCKKRLDDYIISSYRVIQEETAIIWEIIVCVILSKKVHMNMGPILNGYRDTEYRTTRSQVH